MPNYYLADGDLYFSKKISSDATAPVKKTKHRSLEKYRTVTVHVDESLAAVMDEHWSSAINQTIAEWNANEEVHFHFALTNSTSANINIVKDTDLPKDLAIASEFPRNGRTGSSIRINVASTKVVEDPKQAFTHALQYCVGFLHSTSLKNKEVKVNDNALHSARGPRWKSNELYAIQGDVLYRVNASTGEYYALKAGWAGTEVMGQLNGTLYIVQLGTLYAVSPSTGSHTELTNDWEGSQYITKIKNKLYIMQDSWIWPVNPDTGGWDESIGAITLARGMVGFHDPIKKKYRLAVLRRKQGSSTLSQLSVLDPFDGELLSRSLVPASGVGSWNGAFLLVNAAYLQVFNGTLNWISDGEVVSSFDEWPNVELAIASGNSIWVINSGTLYNIQPEGVYMTTRLGAKRAWVDTSCFICKSKNIKLCSRPY